MTPFPHPLRLPHCLPLCLPHCLLLCAALLAAPAWAEDPFTKEGGALVTGKIVTQTGVPVQGYPVIATTQANGLLQQFIAVTDASGTYSFDGLGAGDYSVRPITNTDHTQSLEIIPDQLKSQDPAALSIEIPQMSITTGKYGQNPG